MESGWIGVTHAGDPCWTKVRLLEDPHQADHYTKMEETLLGWESLLVKEVLSNLNQVDQMVIFIGGGNRSEEVHKWSLHSLGQCPGFHIESCFLELLSE